MRTARIESLADCADQWVSQLLKSAELDMLQLDYRWPTFRNIAPNSATGGCDGFASACLSHMRALNTALYLQPELQVITNAGGENVVGSVEAIADFACHHDNRQLPLAAVRGGNLLPRLEEFSVRGIPLVDRATGQNIARDPRPILAAQLDLGAGPLAMALNEGARIVVSGGYDKAAPMIAAGVCLHGWNWSQHDCLAAAAMAAYSSTLASVVALGEKRPRDVELSAIASIEQDGCCKLSSIASASINPAQLVSLLQAEADQEGLIRCADVLCQTTDVKFSNPVPGELCFEGVRGLLPGENWLLTITVDDGFMAQGLLELKTQGQDKAMEQSVETLQVAFEDMDPQMGELSFRQLVRSSDDETLAMVVGLCSKKREDCEAFLNRLYNYALRCGPAGWRIASPPVTFQVTDTIQAEIPKDAVELSVDTRPSQDWV